MKPQSEWDREATSRVKWVDKSLSQGNLICEDNKTELFQATHYSWLFLAHNYRAVKKEWQIATTEEADEEEADEEGKKEEELK